MKVFLIFIFLILLVNCSFNKSEQGVSKNKISHTEINSRKNYSFEEYVNLLLRVNKSKKLPDIKNIPD